MARKEITKKRSKSVEENNKTDFNTPSTEESKLKQMDLFDPIFNSLSPDASGDLTTKRDELIKIFFTQICEKHSVITSYNILILHDQTSMLRTDVDKIYSTIRNFKNQKPILLILDSSGGDISSAYLIGKLCREHANKKFIVVVPRRAKSAATLLCCAADEIHMGSLSELGPIDPQIDGLPTLGLKSAVEHMADMMKEYPKAADMFAKYLSYSLKPISLGYYERVAMSAKQYAERLLKTHETNLKEKAEKIATTLVYDYKDHGFVIDKDEASSILGEKVVKRNTAEYVFGNEIYEALSFIGTVADYRGYYFYLIGTYDSPIQFLQRKKL